MLHPFSSFSVALRVIGFVILRKKEPQTNKAYYYPIDILLNILSIQMLLLITRLQVKGKTAIRVCFLGSKSKRKQKPNNTSFS